MQDTSKSEPHAAWLTGTTGQDLIRFFPLPIALLDDAGALVLLNDRFARVYGAGVLASAALQAVIRKGTPGWHRVPVPGGAQGDIEIKVQVLQFQGHLILMIDDATDPGLLRQLDQLHGQISELERLSSTDRLTGAWNRAHLDRVVPPEIDRSKRFRQPVSLILLDIDNFKQINDSFGHQAGDTVLWELVQVIGALVRTSDTLFRWGGEEFVVLATSTGYRAGTTLAERIRGKIEQHAFPGVGPMTVSIGVAEHLPDERAEAWFRRADEALYRAKNGGRNRISVDPRGSSDAWVAGAGASAIHLVWQEAYGCGEPTIDRQHRELFALSNSLLDASFQTDGSLQDFNEAFERLMAHVVLHFDDEEAILARHGFKDLDAHRRTHAGLIERAVALRAAVAQGQSGVGDLVEFLANTVVAQHLLKVDREFYPLFSPAGPPV